MAARVFMGLASTTGRNGERAFCAHRQRVRHCTIAPSGIADTVKEALPESRPRKASLTNEAMKLPRAMRNRVSGGKAQPASMRDQEVPIVNAYRPTSSVRRAPDGMSIERRLR